MYVAEKGGGIWGKGGGELGKRGGKFAESEMLNTCVSISYKAFFLPIVLIVLIDLIRQKKKRSLGSIFFRLFFLMFEQFYSITGEDSLQHTEQEGQLPYSLRTTE